MNHYLSDAFAHDHISEQTALFALVFILLFQSSSSFRNMAGILPTHIQVQRTLAIIKPDAADKEDEIVVKIQQAGFRITNVRPSHRNPSQHS